MRILIIEDELLAQAKLESMLLSIDPGLVIVGKPGSVKESVAWLRNNPAPDLAFIDIQLSDHPSFEIFKQHTITFPVVFTTAYDQYVLQAFAVNSVDYLLKPITEEKLKHAFEKVRTLEKHFIQGNLDRMMLALQQPASRTRLLVRRGSEQQALNTSEVAYFFSEQKILFVKDITSRQFMMDGTLSELEGTLNSKDFFRINRQYIAHIQSVEKFKSDNGRIRVFLQPPPKEEIFVSKETAPMFRAWMEGH